MKNSMFETRTFWKIREVKKRGTAQYYAGIRKLDSKVQFTNNDLKKSPQGQRYTDKAEAEDQVEWLNSHGWGEVELFEVNYIFLKSNR